MKKLTLENLVRKIPYYENDLPTWGKNIWKNVASFDWFVKDNKEALLQSGALVRIGRDYFIEKSIFPKSAETLLGVEQQPEKEIQYVRNLILRCSVKLAEIARDQEDQEAESLLAECRAVMSNGMLTPNV